MGACKTNALASVAALQQRAETQGQYAAGILNDLELAEQLTTLRVPILGTVQRLAVHTIDGITGGQW